MGAYVIGAFINKNIKDLGALTTKGVLIGMRTLNQIITGM